MKILRNKQIKAGLMLMTFAILVMAANRNNEISTLNGPLILNASSENISFERNLMPSLDSSLQIGDAGAVCSEVWVDAIKTDGDLTLNPSGGEVQLGNSVSLKTKFVSTAGDIGVSFLKDGSGYLNLFIDDSQSDKLRFYDYTQANDFIIYEPSTGDSYFRGNRDLYLLSTAAGYLTTTTDFTAQVQGGDFFIKDNDGQMALYIQSGSVSGIPLIRFGNSGDNLEWEIASISNSADQLYFKNSAEALKLVLEQDGDFFPGGDNAQSNGLAGNRWSDTRSVLINGADICLENNICLTECVNNQGQVDACWVYGKPTREQASKIAAATFDTYQEYVDSHQVLERYVVGQEYIEPVIEDGVEVEPGYYQDITETRFIFDESLTEQEWNTIRAETMVNGKYDFTFGRTVRLSMRDVKETIERLDDIEQTLCDQGLNKYC